MTDLQKLLRLKRYEQPGDEFFENFRSDLQERQREEMLHLSSFRIMRERFQLWFDQLPRGAVAAVLTAAYALALSLIWFWPQNISPESDAPEVQVMPELTLTQQRQFISSSGRNSIPVSHEF